MENKDVIGKQSTKHAGHNPSEIYLPADKIEEVDKSLERIEGYPDISPRVREEAEKARTILAMQSHEYSGPIPPPELLIAFEQVLPGLAERIVKSSEVEAEHRRFIQRTTLLEEIKLRNRPYDERRLGQILGFSIGVIAIVAGVIASYLGHPITGGFVGTGGVLGLVTAFLFSKSTKPKEKDETIPKSVKAGQKGT